MNADRIKQFGSKHISKLLGPLNLIHKYDDLIKSEGVQQMAEPIKFLPFQDLYKKLCESMQDELSLVDAYGDWVVHQQLAMSFHLLIHCCAEHQHLSYSIAAMDYFNYFISHSPFSSLKYLITFINHKKFQSFQIQNTTYHQVKQTAWSTDDNMRSCVSIVQFTCILFYRDASKKTGVTNKWLTEVFTKPIEVFEDLMCKFTTVTNYKALMRHILTIELGSHLVENANDKNSRLSHP